jgi:PAS domain-containing protein
MTDGDAVRRWTRILSALRVRSQKVRRPNGHAAGPVDELLSETLEATNGLLQDLAGANLVNDQLRREAHAEALNRQHLIEQMPIACVATDEGSVIQNANQPAAELFNISAKHLRGRLLLHFSADRAAFGHLLHNLPMSGGRLDASLEVRPRERGPFTLTALIVPETTTDRTSWLWFLKPVDLSEARSSDRFASLSAQAEAPPASSQSAGGPPQTAS